MNRGAAGPASTPERLLGPDDPAPYEAHNALGSARVLLVCDHAGRRVPHALSRLGLEDWVFERHVAYDIGAAQVTRRLSRLLDAPALLGTYSRLVVDPNRDFQDPTAVPELSDGILIPGNHGISARQRTERRLAIFDPYHDAIDGRLDAFERAGIYPALIAIHSFTPVFQGDHRPWHVGILWDADPRLAVPMMDALRLRGDLMVGDNQPYSGKHPHDFTMDHHGEGRRIPHVSVEIRQDLIDTETGAEHWAGILAEALRPILADPNLYRLLD